MDHLEVKILSGEISSQLQASLLTSAGSAEQSIMLEAADRSDILEVRLVLLLMEL